MIDFCCSNIELVEEGEVVDTYGGNYTYQDTYICKECRRVFYIYTSCIYKERCVEEMDEDNIEYILSLYQNI